VAVKGKEPKVASEERGASQDGTGVVTGDTLVHLVDSALEGSPDGKLDRFALYSLARRAYGMGVMQGLAAYPQELKVPWGNDRMLGSLFSHAISDLVLLREAALTGDKPRASKGLARLQETLPNLFELARRAVNVGE
jgi:hypothetical protein